MYLPEAESLLITEKEADLRLDKLLALHYPEQSRSYFQWLIQQGYVHLNHHPVKKRKRPEVGDTVEIRFVLSPELKLEPEAIPLDILYEDDWMVAVNKPRGLVVHPGAGNWSGTLVNALLYHCHELQLHSADVRPGIVHRLDKETSGVLIAAKRERVQQKLQAQFAGRRVRKEYLAICVGQPGSGEIRTLIGRNPHDRKEMAVVETGGREAVTEFETIASDGKISLVRLKPITGRTHQIRVHMAHLNAPILGDPVYGNRQWNERYKRGQQQLHAHRITFYHPTSHEMMTVTAPLPEDMVDLIRRHLPTVPMETFL